MRLNCYSFTFRINKIYISLIENTNSKFFNSIILRILVQRYFSQSRYQKLDYFIIVPNIWILSNTMATNFACKALYFVLRFFDGLELNFGPIERMYRHQTEDQIMSVVNHQKGGLNGRITLFCFVCNGKIVNNQMITLCH